MTDEEYIEALVELVEIVRPFEKALHVNDSDTLSMMLPDDYIIWHATGSWQSAEPLTLGHFRKLARFLFDMKRKENELSKN